MVTLVHCSRHIWAVAIMEQQGSDLLTPPTANTHILYKKENQTICKNYQFSGIVQTEQEVYLYVIGYKQDELYLFTSWRQFSGICRVRKYRFQRSLD